MTSAQACALAEAAFARKPESPSLRGWLAGLLIQQDRFKEAVALFEHIAVDTLEYGPLAALIHAHLSFEQTDDNARAAELGALMVSRASNPSQHASALALEAKALVRLGQSDAAEALLRTALALDPHHKDACKRLAAIHLNRGTVDALLTDMAKLQAQGAGHSRLFAAQVLALANLGQLDAAHALNGGRTLTLHTQLAAPDGWVGIDAFNAALAQELVQHRAIRSDRYGAASEYSWRIEDLATGTSDNVRHLHRQLRAAIDAHLGRLSPRDHPWLGARPDAGLLHSWCVITEGAGFENWHVHQFGWLSGVYYVQVPDSISEGDGDGGCISFGLPQDMIGDAAAAAFGIHTIRPKSGDLLLFPSHSYHRTYPHGLNDRRICIAFDIWPS